MEDELARVPEEFRPACGRPGSRVIVRHFPVTIPHALCDLTGVAIAYPRHGGATVHATPAACWPGQSARVWRKSRSLAAIQVLARWTRSVSV
jgi:hypothetical protein